MNTVLPVLRLENLDVELSKLGAFKRKILSTTSVEKFDKDSISERQRGQLRFIPKSEVVLLEGSDNLWFRSVGSNWATTFVMLPGDLVLLTAEYVAGADIVVIAHCAGVSAKGESMADCAKRETEEESGIVLEKVVPLSKGGLPVSSRKSTERVFPFIGVPMIDSEGKTVSIPTRHDECEDIHPFLMSLQDYWTFLNDSRYNNSVVARDCAYSALRYLGKLSLS